MISNGGPLKEINKKGKEEKKRKKKRNPELYFLKKRGERRRFHVYVESLYLERYFLLLFHVSGLVLRGGWLAGTEQNAAGYWVGYGREKQQEQGIRKETSCSSVKCNRVGNWLFSCLLAVVVVVVL